jgi:SIR2-like domain
VAVIYDVGDLIDSIIERKAIAFIGSGVSAGAHLPDWPALLRELIETGFKRQNLSASEKDELLAWATKPDYLMLADAIRDRLTRPVFQDFLARKFNETKANPTALHKALAAIPFAAFVTTNFDRLFENAWSDVHHNSLEVLTHLDRSALRNPLGRDFPFLLKTHGCASKPDTLVLGLKEFRDSIHDNRPCQTLLQSIFLRYQVLFIGHSLTDPDLLFLLDQLVATFGVPPGRHFALIKDADVGPLRARTFRDNYGIEVLRYTATDGHPEVLAFVQELQKQVQERRAELNREVSRKLQEELQLAASTVAPSAARVVAETASQPRPAGQYSEPTLTDYCLRYLDKSIWPQLAPWYDSLHGSTERDLLRINLDRECAREDLEPHIWQEFLRRLASRSPTAADPLTPLRKVTDEDPGLFVLRGRALETAGALRRYLRYADFQRVLAGILSGTSERLASDGSALENSLLGRPGHPVWCTDETYAEVTDPDVIALDLWPQTASPIVEIAYTKEILMPDNYVRVATVPDIYWSDPDYINVKKPALGASDWCHTVRLDDATLCDRTPSAVHAPLRLLAARTKRIALRTIGA